MRRILLFCGLLLFAGMANATLTGLTTDVLEPAWRGQTNTTLQAWSFSTADNPALLTLNMNPYGTPAAQVFVPDTGSPQYTWMDTHGSRHSGVWRIHDDDYLLSYLPNTPNQQPNSYKDIRLQITYSAGSIDRKPQIHWKWCVF